MKTATKKLFCILLVVAVLACTITVIANAEETIHPVGDPLTYTVLTESTVMVSDCEEGLTDITIPATVEGYTVTRISGGLFYGYDSLETLTFEDGCKIETINNAFNNCSSLTTINWGTDSALKEITNSFKNCTSLEEITIPACVEIIGRQSFKNCVKLSKINFESGSQLKEIRAQAFAYMGKEDATVPATITNLTFPASLEALSESAFHCIPVEHFALEEHSLLTEIPDGFLAADGADGVPGTKTECTHIWDYVIEWFRELVSPYPFTPEEVAKACDCLVSIDLGDYNSIERIGMGAFKNQTHLTEINFGENAVSEGLKIARGAFVAIGNNASYEDETLGGIDTLVFPVNLVELGDHSFEAARIKNIVFSDGAKIRAIPDGFMEISGVGFNGHPGASDDGSITFVKNPVQIGANCIESISFGANNVIETIGRGAFKNQSHLTSIDFGTSDIDLTLESGTFIGVGNNAYLVENGVDTELCGGIETLVLPANLVKMYEGAFDYARVKHLVISDNSKLSSIPSSFLDVDGVGNNGYPGQTGYNREDKKFVNDPVQIAVNCLESIDFGNNNSLSRIEYGAFKNQSHLTSIDFGTSTVDLTLDYGVFIGVGNNAYLVENGVDTELCEGIETLVLPANLEKMYEGAFDYARVKHLVISDNSKLSSIPRSFLGIDGEGNNAHPGEHGGYYDEEKTFVYDPVQIAANCLESVKFGKNNSLSKIAAGAFKNQSHLTTIDFGTSSVDLTFDSGIFIGVGNNAYLVEQGIDTELCDGIDTLVIPANLVRMEVGAFESAKIKNLVFSDNSRLDEIPNGFLGVDGEGNNAHPGEHGDYDEEKTFVYDPAQIEANSLVSVKFGNNNSLSRIDYGAFKNQSHLTTIDFGTSTVDLTLESGTFIGVGNNAYLVEQGVDTELCEGIETLVLPANLVEMDVGTFESAKIKNLVFSDNSRLKVIPNGFLGVDGEGNNAHPGEHGGYYDEEKTFVYDPVQIEANSLVSVKFGNNNSLSRIDYGAFKNQSHLTNIDFGTSTVDLTIENGAFIGAGNNAYLVEQGVDTELCGGIETLVLPANLVEMQSGVFGSAKIKNLAFSDNSRLSQIPSGFLGVDGEGNNAHPGEHGGYYDEEKTFVYDPVQIEANSLVSVNFGKNNSLSNIGCGAFKNQSHLTNIDFGTSTVDLTLESGTFIGVGNNAYLVEQGIDTELCEGIETLVLPANLVKMYEGAFNYARVKHLVISDNSKLSSIPNGFLGVDGEGHNGYPGEHVDYYENVKTFVYDPVQIAANCLESVSLGKSNNISYINSGAYKNQSHLTTIDFGTSDVDLTLESGTFIGVGNNAYLVENGIDDELLGIDTLVLPANIVRIQSGTFDYARVKHLVINDNSKLNEIPNGFMAIDGEGSNGAPGQHGYDEEKTFINDPVQIAVNCLESVELGKNNNISRIGSGAFKNQSHLTTIDFGTSDVDLTLESGTFIGVGNNAYLVENGIDDELNYIDTLVLPANLVKMYSGSFDYSSVKHLVFSDNSKLSSIPSGFMQIGGEGGIANNVEAARIGANILESVDFGKNNSLTEIGYGAFHYQSHLTDIKFQSNSTAAALKLDAGAFQGLLDIETLVLDSECLTEELDGGVFSSCNNVTVVNLRESNITKIGDALKENINLTKIVFPKGLTKITWNDPTDDETCPFYGDSNVNRLVFASADPSVYSFDEGVFQFVNEAGIVFVPAATTDEDIEAYKALLTNSGLTFAEDKWIIRAVDYHELEKNEAVEATCTEDGSKEYYSCKLEGCELYFADEDALVEISMADIVVPAKGHNWSSWTSISRTQHQRTCSADGTHIETEDHHFTGNVCDDCGYTRYTVDFEMNGHGTSVADQIIDEGDKAEKPEEPSEEGYEFNGWYIDSDLLTEFDFDQTITKDTTVYAKWTKLPVVYTIIDGADGEWKKGTEDSFSLTSDASFDIFDSVKVDGFTIDSTNYTAVAGSTKITLSAEYLETLSDGVHTVEVVSADGSATTTLTIQPKTTGVVTISKSFSGDIPDSDFIAEIFFTIANDDGTFAQEFTLGANFAADRRADNAYVFSLELEPGTYTICESYCEREGYNKTVYCKVDDGEKSTDDEVTVTVETGCDIMISVENIYVELITVDYEMNGYGNQVPSETIEKGDKATMPENPSEEGYTFEGWYADAEFSEKFDFTADVAEDTTVYAKWTKKTEPITPEMGEKADMSLWITLLLAGSCAFAMLMLLEKRKKKAE